MCGIDKTFLTGFLWIVCACLCPASGHGVFSYMPQPEVREGLRHPADSLLSPDSSLHSSSDPEIEIRTFRKQYTIYFKINRYDIDTSFRGNGAVIRRMRTEIDSLISEGIITADSIRIVSAASPDGGNAFNIWLSRQRGLAANALLEKSYPDIDPEIIFTDPVGEDWSTFRQVVYEDNDIPDREKLIALMESDLTNDEKERQLRRMNPTFRYILRHYIYMMRASSVTFNMSVPVILMPPLSGPQALAEGYPGDILRPVVKFAPVPVSVSQPQAEKKMVLAARSNLLVPALNVGVEIPVMYSWSIGADYFFPWWLAGNNQYCAEMLGWFLDTKYWFGQDRTEADKLTGHAVGVYAGFGYYDYQWKRSGYQGEYVDIGIDYTYSIPLAKDKLRMEFNVGLGWIHTVARHYTPTDDYADLIKDPGIKHRKYNFLGPTRASVSLVVPIRVKVRKKGGEI